MQDLQDLIAQQAALIEQMREFFTEIAASSNAHVSHLLACEALALQPCPEVLNKVRADAVREVINSIKGHACSEITRKALDFADLIENGEA